MNDDPLQVLLQTAERATAAAPQAFVPEALLAAARRRRVRRTATRSAAAAALTLLLAAPFLASDWSLKRPVRPTQDAALARAPVHVPAHAPAPAHAPPAPPAPAVDLESLQHELARLEREAAMHEQIIAAALAPDPPDEPPARLGLSDAELVRLETARNAAISLQYAEIAERELHDVETARREYERVVQRFPGTEWSQVAAASLERLGEAHAPPSI